jgi:hypothetical protein
MAQPVSQPAVYASGLIKENEAVGFIARTWVVRNWYKSQCEFLKERDRLEDPDFDWRMILKFILAQKEGNMWAEFTCLRIGTSGGFLEHATLHFTKEGQFERKRQYGVSPQTTTNLVHIVSNSLLWWRHARLHKTIPVAKTKDDQPIS